MQTKSLLEHLLCDEVSLRYYMEGNIVSCSDVQRRLFEMGRKDDIHVPDHYYRLLKENCLGNITSLADLLIISLPSFADEYIEKRDDLLYVKAEKQNEWQMLLSEYSPLLLIAAKLCHDYACPLKMQEEIENYFNRYVVQNVKYTALIHPYILQLEDFRETHGGMYDLHIHLNGTMESDHLWQDFLERPNDFLQVLAQKYSDYKVRELYEQFSTIVTPEKIDLLACDANYLRMFLIKHCFLEHKYDARQIVRECTDKQKVYHAVGLNQMDGIVTCNRMQQECMFYVYVLSFLKHYPNDKDTASLFHFYLLINGLLNRLFVMQSRFYGFEEFNKYTLSGIRKASEKFRENTRYLQLAGNDLTNIRMMEGRFSPSIKEKDIAKTIYQIVDSWESFNQIQESEGKAPKKSDLTLIAHFIKSLHGKNGRYFFEEYRMMLEKQVDALANFKNTECKESYFLTGIDAASSEFSTPPEVFGVAYRKLREYGFHHFTFHAGEDFFHLLGGIRAVYEAIHFLDLQRGDRIGHAAALGISSEIWLDNIGNKMLIRQGEYLDDLVFAYHLIEMSNNVRLQGKLPLLTNRINNLCFDIYGQYYSPYIQVRAWQERWNNPKAIFDKKEHVLSEELHLLKKYCEKRGQKKNKYDAIIEIVTYEFFNAEELSELQLMVLQEMHDKEIVIETLPTSNVMIGHHRSYSSYHIYNWYKWAKEEHRPIPPIVLGTDDAGIFATNIFNEYCNVYCQLMYDKKLNAIDIIRFIEELDYNSKLYNFKK